VGYTIGKLYGHALANIKGAVTRQSLNDAVVATRNFPVVLGSGKGNFSFTGPEREPTYEPILITVKDGKFIPPREPADAGRSANSGGRPCDAVSPARAGRDC